MYNVYIARQTPFPNIEFKFSDFLFLLKKEALYTKIITQNNNYIKGG